MGANSTQAAGVAVFLIALTLICAGIAGGGLIWELIGVIALLVSLAINAPYEVLETRKSKARA